jgi:hypothetical protein
MHRTQVEELIEQRKDELRSRLEKDAALIGLGLRDNNGLKSGRRRSKNQERGE